MKPLNCKIGKQLYLYTCCQCGKVQLSTVLKDSLPCIRMVGENNHNECYGEAYLHIELWKG